MSFINISERAYKYIRQFTIKNINDALIELITNSVDAYNKTQYLERVININIYDESRITVTDYAIGLTSSELSNAFLQVGNYTASDTSRGFFSRGAKDISALGNITFDAIKDNKYSQCILDTDAYGYNTIVDVPATIELRNNLNILGQQNGLRVTIDLLPNFQSISIDKTYVSLCNLAVLRDINSDPRNKIILQKINTKNQQIEFTQQISYEYPASTQILEIEYVLPDYPDDVAKFVVYKTDKPIRQPIEEAGLEFGFLIKDANTVYETNTIDGKYRWNPYINYLYGYIYSDAIKKYLMDFDVNGASEKNPYPIIDPSRLTGVNKLHPVIKAIYSIPLVRIDAILRELNNSISRKTVTIEDVNDLLDELGKYGLEIVNTNDIYMNFQPSYDDNLAKAIQDDRANYVRYEKSNVLNSEYYAKEKLIENYALDQIINTYGTSSNGLFYLGSDEKIHQIQSYHEYELNPKINIIEILTQYELDCIKVNPYIYKLSNNGKNLERLYIYQKGKIETSSTESDFVIKNRQFSIQFIKDINLMERYIIDNTNGIVIKLNLNNPMIAKYLTNKNIDSLDDLISLDVVKTTSSLLFLESLIVDILADLIVQSDVNNKKIILDGTEFDNSQKILDYRNKTITKLEGSVEKIFEKYKINVINTKSSLINDLIRETGNKITELLSTDAHMNSQLLLLGDILKNAIATILE